MDLADKGHHDEYWKAVCRDAHARLDNLFGGIDGGVYAVVGDAHGIDSLSDAKRVLAFALRHADTCDEKACAILAVTDIVNAKHELREFHS